MTNSSAPPQDIAKPVPVSGAMLTLLGMTLFSILAVGNAFVLNSVIGRFRLTWVALMSMIEIAFIVGALFFRPNWRPVVRWDWLEIVGMAIVGGAFLAHAIYLAPSDLMPVSFSVDCSHQHLLVNYIYQHDRFPENIGYLYIYDDYPIAPSALAAFLAHLVGVLPAQTLYPLAVLLVTAQVMVVFGISVELLPRFPVNYVLAALAALSIFFVYSYSVHVFAERFYSNMIMGDLVVLLALWVTTVGKRLSSLLIASVTIGLVFGVLNSYPAWLPFVVVPLIMTIFLDRRMSMRGRWVLAVVVSVVTFILTVIAIVDQWEFITWFAPSRGYTLLPSWQSLGSVLLIFVGIGMWRLIRTWKQQRGFTLFLIMDVASVVALYGAAVADKLSRYIPDKTFYFNVFLFTILVALGFNWVLEKLPQPKPSGRAAFATMAVIGVTIVAVVNSRVPRPNAYPITLDEYRVAYQASQEMPEANLTYLVRTGTTFYWIYGTILNHTHDLTAQAERWQVNTPTYEKWVHDATAPNRAMVSDLAMLPQDGHWRIVIRSGNSGVIEKVR